MQPFTFHKLQDEIGETEFTDESISKYFKYRSKLSPTGKPEAFDYNVFDANGLSLLNYSIIANKMGLFETILALKDKTDGIFPFIKYTSPEYPIHTICRLGDYSKFLKFCEVFGSNLPVQFRNLRDQNGDRPFDVLSNLPEAGLENRETIKAGKIKIASFLATHYPQCIVTTHKNEYEETKPYVQHVREKGFPEFAAIIEAHESSHTK